MALVVLDVVLGARASWQSAPVSWQRHLLMSWPRGLRLRCFGSLVFLVVAVAVVVAVGVAVARVGLQWNFLGIH